MIGIQHNFSVFFVFFFFKCLAEAAIQSPRSAFVAREAALVPLTGHFIRYTLTITSAASSSVLIRVMMDGRSIE